MGKLDRRRREILELVASNSFMTIDTLAEHFSVTPQTIRRDINEMAEEGLIARYHGGLQAFQPPKILPIPTVRY